MKNILKQSEESDINSKRNNFHSAVIRLTAYYSVGVIIILTVFSVLVYGLFARSIDEEVREDKTVMEIEEEFHSEAKENLLNILLLSDVIILVIAIFLSYSFSKKTLRPLEIAYQKQKRFVADAAHELRTPLAVMKAGTEVMSQKERSMPEYKKFLSECGEEVNRLIALSNDLLFLARNESEVQNDFAPISLSDIVAKQCELIVPYAKTKDVRVYSDITKEIVIAGKGDNITRMVLNLLKNSVDYNKAGGNVTVTLSKKGNRALFSVQDTGIGIAEKNIPFIFDRFFKADSARTQNSSVGSGLGLAIVNDIVVRHGGKINVTSVLGEGSIFNIEIPFI